MPSDLESTQLTDLGRVRKINQDACLALPKSGFFCVADGMGGGTAGDVASRTIIEEFRSALDRQDGVSCQSLDSSTRALLEAADRANDSLKSLARERQVLLIGTTFVALLLDPLLVERAMVLHAGDSRLYRWRNGVLRGLTTDHTLSALVSQESLGQPEWIPKQMRNRLIRAVGLDERLEVECASIDVELSDMFLLCSDGLSHMLSDATIAKLLAEESRSPLERIARRLIEEANLAGGQDNITVVLLRIPNLR